MRTFLINAVFTIFIIISLFTDCHVALSAERNLSVNSIIMAKISSSINPATLDYLKSTFKKASRTSKNLIIIKLNTPGGLVTTTKKILTLFGDSDIPVVVWIAPEGASATSAGAIISSGAHLLFMASGTNIGAATPVTMGKDIEQKDLRKKAINDLKALVQGLSESRGRNELLFGKMIQDAESFKASDALKKKLINGIANTKEELLKKLDGRTITLKGKKIRLIVKNPIVSEHKMDIGQKLLNILANPNMAYILFLIGAALLYLEFQAPGGYVAGSIGAICLVLAGIGFQLLPLNFGALGLIILSFVFFILEIFITSFGLLSIAGLASLIIGSLFLFRTDDAYISISKSVIFSSAGAVVSFMFLIVFLLLKDFKKGAKVQFHSLVGKNATVAQLLPETEDNYTFYQVKVSGEYWKARSLTKLTTGQHCKIEEEDRKNMILTIKS